MCSSYTIFGSVEKIKFTKYIIMEKVNVIPHSGFSQTGLLHLTLRHNGRCKYLFYLIFPIQKFQGEFTDDHTHRCPVYHDMNIETNRTLW